MPPRLVEQAKVEEAQKLATKLVAHPQHTDAQVCASVVCLNVYICNPGHRVSRARGTGSVGDSVGEG